MSTQYDFNPGLDLSSLSSGTLAQIVQAISQIVPLSNIGGIIVGTTRPDITNNPRFIRYIWLDITSPTNPSFKRYIGDRTSLEDADNKWTAVAVADDAVTTAMLKTIGATGGVDIARLKRNSDYSATVADAAKILRITADGKGVEVAALSTILSNGSVPLAALAPGSPPNYAVLSYINNITAFVAFDPTNMIPSGTIPLTKLVVPGSSANKAIKVSSDGASLEAMNCGFVNRVQGIMNTGRDDDHTSGTGIIGLGAADPASDAGVEIIGLSITTKVANSRIYFKGLVHAAASAGCTIFAIVSNGAAAGTVYGVAGRRISNTNVLDQIIIQGYMTTTTPGAYTFSMRSAVSVAAHFYLNSTAGTRIFAGTLNSSLELEEIIP